MKKTELYYEACVESKWDLEEIKKWYRRCAFAYGLPKISSEEIRRQGLLFVKQNMYLDTFFNDIEKKYGYDKVNELFHALFASFKDLDEYYTYCYDVVQEYSSRTELFNIAVEQGISEKKVEYYARKSSKYDGWLNIDNDNHDAKCEYLKKKYPEYLSLIKFLLKENDFDKIIDYMGSVNYQFSENALRDYARIICHPGLTNEEIDEKICLKYHKYVVFNRKRQKLNERLAATDEEINYAISFLKNCLNKKYRFLVELLNGEGINKTEFKRILQIVKYNKPVLYSKYQSFMEENDDTLITVKEVIQEISRNKDFQLIDFCKMYPFSLEDFNGIVVENYHKHKLTRFEVEIAFHFFNKYRSSRIVSENEIMRENIEMNCLRDKDGFPISGTGHVVTEEEKRKAIDYLKDNNILFYGPNVNYVIRNIVNSHDKVKIKK